MASSAIRRLPSFTVGHCPGKRGALGQAVAVGPGFDGFCVRCGPMRFEGSSSSSPRLSSGMIRFSS